MNTNICPDAVPNFLNFFDLSVAPPLLFYAYIPTIIISLFFGFYIFKKDGHSLQSKLLLGITIAFFVWMLNLILQWTVAYTNVVMFSWQITPFFEIFIPILSIYFTYVFINKKDIPLTAKIIFSFFILTLAITIPTKFNTVSFDYQNCQANYGDVYYHFVYVFEVITIFIVDYICLRKYLKVPKEDLSTKKQVLILATGSTLFLTIFSLSNVLGEYTKTYEINLFGPIGLLVFIGFLTFMIVRYGIFNMKLVATQALVISISILFGTQLFAPSNTIDKIITVFTLVSFLVAGFFLINSVKREIESKEQLAVANERQKNLIHVMNHQIKGFFTVARNIFAELSEGETYGKMPEKVQLVVLKGMKEMNDGVDYVQSILKGESALSGALRFHMKPMDLKLVIEDLVSKQKVIAEKDGLSFASNISDGNYNIIGDKLELYEAFKNLFTNAIKYNNPNGSIKVTMFNKNNKIIVAIEDTGIGISEYDQKNLFKPGGIGKDSIKHNTDASGYGLAFVKPAIEAHKGGKIWYDTEVGKGTTFFVELSIDQSSTSNYSPLSTTKADFG